MCTHTHTAQHTKKLTTRGKFTPQAYAHAEKYTRYRRRPTDVRRTAHIRSHNKTDDGRDALAQQHSAQNIDERLKRRWVCCVRITSVGKTAAQRHTAQRAHSQQASRTTRPKRDDDSLLWFMYTYIYHIVCRACVHAYVLPARWHITRVWRVRYIRVNARPTAVRSRRHDGVRFALARARVCVREEGWLFRFIAAHSGRVGGVDVDVDDMSNRRSPHRLRARVC